MLKHHIKAENIFGSDEDPSSAEYNKIIADISRKLRAGKRKVPMERYLIIFVFVG